MFRRFYSLRIYTTLKRTRVALRLHCVSIPYEFTLLSNPSSRVIMPFLVSIPYEFTLLSNACPFSWLYCTFLFPTNLHYSQTSNSNISLKGLILSPVLRASAYTNATTYKSLKDGVRKEIYLYIKQSPTWLSINFTQVFIYYQTLFKRQAAIVPVFNH